MNIVRLLITNHETGWKGSWYKTGQKVYARKTDKEYITCKYHSVDANGGGIMVDDCKILTDRISIMLCRLKAFLIWAGIQEDHSRHINAGA